MRIAREASTLLHDVGLIRPLDGWPKHPDRQTPLSPCPLVLCVRVRVGLGLVDLVSSRARVVIRKQMQGIQQRQRTTVGTSFIHPSLITDSLPYRASAHTHTHTRLISHPPILLSSYIDPAKATDRDLRPFSPSGVLLCSIYK